MIKKHKIIESTVEKLYQYALKVNPTITMDELTRLSSEIVHMFFCNLIEKLIDDESGSVNIEKFGSFKVRYHKPRIRKVGFRGSIERRIFPEKVSVLFQVNENKANYILSERKHAGHIPKRSSGMPDASNASHEPDPDDIWGNFIKTLRPKK